MQAGFIACTTVRPIASSCLETSSGCSKVTVSFMVSPRVTCLLLFLMIMAPLRSVLSARRQFTPPCQQSESILPTLLNRPRSIRMLLFHQNPPLWIHARCLMMTIQMMTIPMPLPMTLPMMTMTTTITTTTTTIPALTMMVMVPQHLLMPQWEGTMPTTLRCLQAHLHHLLVSNHRMRRCALQSKQPIATTLVCRRKSLLPQQNQAARCQLLRKRSPTNSSVCTHHTIR
mmetsp:Transcript_3182/g.9026  ORF Transcript_3182/g.9026 Transcript_3182/m.9026 type:complete len:229 (-) Transcript_3182:1132-1818(-)